MNKIDIIIPAYNAHATLNRCLASILAQTIAEGCAVTIVDDCSAQPYDALLAPWKGLLDIRLHRLEENRGPGYARQYGYDHTDNPLVTYIDADDTFAGAYALELLRKGLEDPQVHTCAGAFVEEQIDGAFNVHQQDLIWVFGKMYRRAYLDKHQVRFLTDGPASRANEDNGYNTTLRLLSTDQERINFIADTVYYWHMLPGSITRANDCQYSYDQSFVGYAANMAQAIQHARKYRPFSEPVAQWTVWCMCHLYAYYMQTVARAPRFAAQNWAACRDYYKAVYQPIEAQVTRQALCDIYAQAMANEIPRAAGVAPHLTIWQFLDKMREGLDDDPIC